MKMSEVCPIKKELSFCVNINRKEDLEGLEKLGYEIARQQGIIFEGYSVCTAPPYSLENALPTLFFID